MDHPTRRTFKYHPDYSQLLSGAHRKPATIINTPTLTCHLAFWQPPAEPPAPQDSGAPALDPREKWKNNIDSYIASIYRFLRREEINIGSNIRQFSCFNTDTKEFAKAKYIFLFSRAIDIALNKLILPRELPDDVHRDFDQDYQSVVFSFWWHHILVNIRFELHHEYMCMTIFFDLSELPKIGTAQITVNWARNDAYYREIFNRFSSLNKLIVEGSRNKTEFEKIHELFYNVIWHRFVEEVVLIKRMLVHREAIGEVFADFRGLVLTRPRDEPADQSPDTRAFFQLPGWREPEPKRDFTVASRLTGNEAARILESFWPLLMGETRVPFREYELTASRMLDGRAIYVTALGPQPSRYIGKLSYNPERIPLYYLLYSHAVRHWQIGRLIDRIHHLGSVRIAAIQELRKLRLASTEIPRLAQQVDEVVEDLTKDSANDPSRAAQSLFETISIVQTKLADISTGFTGGLLYRIERSRYYVKQFRDGIPGLRVRRIEGFQPYDVFVERRLGATFDFIDRLGRRHERLENHLGALYQYFLAYNGISINAEIEQRNERIQDIQASAEVFFLMLPAPYYTMGIYEHLFGASHTPPSIQSAPTAPSPPPISTVPPLPGPADIENPALPAGPSPGTSTNVAPLHEAAAPVGRNSDSIINGAIFIAFAIFAALRYRKFAKLKKSRVPMPSRAINRRPV
jgi:hypothetical protein